MERERSETMRIQAEQKMKEQELKRLTDEVKNLNKQKQMMQAQFQIKASEDLAKVQTEAADKEKINQ